MSVLARFLPKPVSLLYVLSMATIFGTMVLMAFLTLTLVWPKTILTVNRLPMEVLTPTVRAGEAVRIRIDYCKTEERHSLGGMTLARRGELITFPAVMSSLPKGCHVMILSYHIPAWVPPGNYKAYITREYRPTVFRETHVLIESDAFDVTPRAEPLVDPDDVGPRFSPDDGHDGANPLTPR